MGPLPRLLDARCPTGSMSRTPQDPKGALSGPELAGIRPGAAAAGGLDGLGHARGDRGLVPAAHGSARAAPGLLGRGDRDRAPAAPGLWSALAADRRPAALARHPARLGYRRSRPYDLLPAQPRPDARQVAGEGPEDRTGSRRDRFNWPEGVRRRRVADREAWRTWPADLAQTPSRGRSQQRRDPGLRANQPQLRI